MSPKPPGCPRWPGLFLPSVSILTLQATPQRKSPNEADTGNALLISTLVKWEADPSGVRMLPKRYVVEVQDDHIVVRVTATSYAVS